MSEPTTPDERRARYAAAIDQAPWARAVERVMAVAEAETADLRGALEQAQVERDALDTELEQARGALVESALWHDRERRALGERLGRARAEVDRLTGLLGECADRGIANGQRADRAEAKLAEARARLAALAQVRVWRMEAGQGVMFAAEVAAALGIPVPDAQQPAVEWAIRVPPEPGEDPDDDLDVLCDGDLGDRREQEERLDRYRDCWPDAVLVQRPVWRGPWTPAPAGEDAPT